MTLILFVPMKSCEILQLEMNDEDSGLIVSDVASLRCCCSRITLPTGKTALVQVMHNQTIYYILTNHLHLLSILLLQPESVSWFACRSCEPQYSGEAMVRGGTRLLPHGIFLNKNSPRRLCSSLWSYGRAKHSL
jgi:hypothetical protein